MNNSLPSSQRIGVETAAQTAALLSQAIAAGLPLEAALRAVAVEAPPRERVALQRLADRLSSGVPPEEAMLDPSLPKPLSVLVVAGLQSGRLGTFLGRYAVLTASRREYGQRLLMALLYPAILMLAAALFLVGLLTIVVPMFGNMFFDFGVELPAMTRFVMWMSATLLSPLTALALVVAIFLLVCGVYWMWNRRSGSPVPWPFSIFNQAADWGRFCDLLALLVDSGIPLPDALRLAADTAGTRRVREAAVEVAHRIAAGESGSNAAARLPGPIRQAFRWSDRRDTFVEWLGGLARQYQTQAQFGLSAATLVAEPVAITTVALCVGGVVTALFFPLISLLTSLS